jgi:hypothetical protein
MPANDQPAPPKPRSGEGSRIANREARTAIQAIVFDFDGVLADSEPLHLRSYQQVLTPLGVTVTRDEYYTHYLGYDDEGVFTKIA